MPINLSNNLEQPYKINDNLQNNIKIALISLTDKRDPTPPLGLVSIATYVKNKLGLDNIKIFEYCYDSLSRSIKKFKPDIVGISVMTVDYPKARNLAIKLKKTINSYIIIGGVHISTLPTSFKNCFDIGVIGEGEQTFLELTKLFLKEKEFRTSKLKKIKGLIFFEKNQLIITPNRGFMNLKHLPIPDRSFLNPRHYKKTRLFKFREYGIGDIIVTSRGCSYNCLYCSSATFWGKKRCVPIDKVIKELNYIINTFGVTHITIWDDLFASDKKYLKELKEKIHKENIHKKVKFSCHLRADMVNKETCVLLKKIGVTSVDLGFESGSSKVLKFLKKGKSSVEKNKNALKLCKENGFFVIGNLIFGVPNETLKDMKKTLDFIDYAIWNKIDRLSCFVLSPFPGTWMWDFIKKNGGVSEDINWSLFSFQNVDSPLLLNKTISRKDFKRIFLLARSRLQYQKVKDISSYFRSSPLRFFADMITNPFYYIKKFLILTEDYGAGK